MYAMVDGDSPKFFVGLCFIRINLILALEDLAMIMFLFIQRFVMMQVLLFQTIIIIYILTVAAINLPHFLPHENLLRNLHLDQVRLHPQ